MPACLRDFARSAGWVALLSRPFASLSLCPTLAVSGRRSNAAFQVQQHPRAGGGPAHGFVSRQCSSH